MGGERGSMGEDGFGEEVVRVREPPNGSGGDGVGRPKRVVALDKGINTRGGQR